MKLAVSVLVVLVGSSLLQQVEAVRLKVYCRRGAEYSAAIICIIYWNVAHVVMVHSC